MMDRRRAIKFLGATIPVLFLRKFSSATPDWAKAPFNPNWQSLERYNVPDWFRDAKFGIWAHWGPQCQPEYGDWYAQGMYKEGSDQYNYHLEKYGHPSVFGFKDVIHTWKAEKWDPEQLVEFYRKIGAQYFMAMANHHDNLDLYDSTHHAWNSTRIGPKKDIIKGWRDAAKRQGLRFGVSVHAAHAWTWYEPAQLSDKKGGKVGVAYDGKATKKDGFGKWWDGMDPQELYVQEHALSQNAVSGNQTLEQWDWKEGSGVSIPSQKYNHNFRERTVDLIDKYHPDLVYFDDTALPLWPVSSVGLDITSHYYNKSQKENNGVVDVVVTGKLLDAQQRKCLVWDIERGHSQKIEPIPWQTCTCIGSWHYDMRIYDRDQYKSALTVLQTLVDVVSKNGNLLLSIPLRGDGSLDDKAYKIVSEIGDWMAVNQEAIIGTRPWHTFGEGPAQKFSTHFDGPGNNEGKGIAFSGKDVRFTTKGPALYAFIMGSPDQGKVKISSLANGLQQAKRINSVTVLGSNEEIVFDQDQTGLSVVLPKSIQQQDSIIVIKLT